MILVDTSVWIDHLHQREPRLVEQLERDEVAVHPLIVEELALGSIAERAAMLGLLDDLVATPVVSHQELRTFVDSHRLWGRGLSAVDAHLLASVRLAEAQLWTRDRRLASAANDVGVSRVPWT